MKSSFDWQDRNFGSREGENRNRMVMMMMQHTNDCLLVVVDWSKKFEVFVVVS